MAQWIINRIVDLRNNIGIQSVGQARAVRGESNAHTWRVTVLDGMAAANLDGYSVQCSYIRPDGGTIYIDGSISGNVAEIVFPAACYAYVGTGSAILRLINNAAGVNVVIDGLMFTIGESETDVVIDPGNVVPSLSELLAQMEAMEAATSEANDAAALANAKAALADTATTNANNAASAANAGEAARSVFEAWNSAKAYVVGNKVAKDGSSYRCIAPNTNQAPPNATYWMVIAAKGDNTTAAAVSTGDGSNVQAKLDAHASQLAEKATYDKITDVGLHTNNLIFPQNLLDRSRVGVGYYQQNGALINNDFERHFKVAVVPNGTYCDNETTPWLAVGVYVNSSGAFVSAMTATLNDGKRRVWTVPNNTAITHAIVNFMTNRIHVAGIYTGQILPPTTVLFTGDSLCQGVGAGGGWAGIFAKKYPTLTTVNYGIGGTTIAKRDGRTDSILERIATMQTAGDIIILQGGINDAWASSTIPFGEISTGYAASLDETTFCGAFESMLKSAMLKWKGSKIAYITTWRTAACAQLGTYMDAAKTMCAKWGVPVIDLYTNIGLCLGLGDIATLYTISGGDDVHLNARGYEKIYPKIEAAMQTL